MPGNELSKPLSSLYFQMLPCADVLERVMQCSAANAVVHSLSFISALPLNWCDIQFQFSSDLRK